MLTKPWEEGADADAAEILMAAEDHVKHREVLHQLREEINQGKQLTDVQPTQDTDPASGEATDDEEKVAADTSASEQASAIVLVPESCATSCCEILAACREEDIFRMMPSPRNPRGPAVIVKYIFSP